MPTLPPSIEMLRWAVSLYKQHGHNAAAAARAAGRSASTFKNWIERARAAGLLTDDSDPAPQPQERPQEAPSDPVALRSLKDELARTRAALADMERRAAVAESIRADVLGLMAEPLRPRIVIPQKQDGEGGRTVILHLSDVHYGETVDLEEMDGVNRYDVTVARARLGRFFSRAASLMTEH